MFKLLSFIFYIFLQAEERRDHAQISFEVSPKFILNPDNLIIFYPATAANLTKKTYSVRIQQCTQQPYCSGQPLHRTYISQFHIWEPGQWFELWTSVKTDKRAQLGR